MKQNHAEINIVLDRSGSMMDVVQDTIGGFNKFLEDQKKAPGTATFTLNQFSDRCERVVGPIDIKDVKPLDSNVYVPRGNTALLDAIGQSIDETGSRIGGMPENDRPDKVVMVIITDGEENSSKRFTLEKINEMISHQRDVYKWEFVFIGADQDAIATASSMSIGAANSMTYAKNTAGTQALFSSVASNLSNLRSGKVRTMAFTDQDKKAQADAGAYKAPAGKTK